MASQNPERTLRSQDACRDSLERITHSMNMAAITSSELRSTASSSTFQEDGVTDSIRLRQLTVESLLKVH